MKVAYIVLGVGLVSAFGGALWLPYAQYRDRIYVIGMLIGGVLIAGLGVAMMAFG